ncbi:class I SAM-dependent methyltransferase [Halorarum halophilum]|uniref:Class I SAM-dependent methyltransferase n=1 Tax=Halorarum halophilum TaxID=2743090 RepID=A0A7D5KKY7_9EURY|nr:class I SAM-dependent methyltransferase [Halobaculum halophilum]QLG26482.1 class I SAM-dependent methyltransferase [Halobaculum halophilum]
MNDGDDPNGDGRGGDDPVGDGSDEDGPAGNVDGDGDEPTSTARTVGETYDRIASHFARTREYPWPEVESFLDGRSGGLGLDLGCGNGRHAKPLAARMEDVVGVDVSRNLLREATDRARERGYGDSFAAVLGDAAALPLRRDIVDVAVYVAALHHLRPRERRVASLSELARVLTPDGRALVSAWCTRSDRFDRTEGFDTEVDWTLPGGRTVPRFYHIYDPEEFRADLDASALRTVEVFVSSGNCYAVVAAE